MKKERKEEPYVYDYLPKRFIKIYVEASPKLKGRPKKPLRKEDVHA